ncbi:MAG: MBOAT family protein [Bacteroidales bacterium]|nr:MBOAT family protein [Bacteroidales bacterium]
MVFSSLTFLFLFLPVVLFLLSLCRKIPYQNTLLFLSSLLFYAWGGVSYTLILLGSIVVNFLAGNAIQNHPHHRKLWFTLAVILNLSSLIFFKYANFLVDNVNVLTSIFGISPIFLKRILLPIGISFYTFQGISYLTDVYRGQVKAQTNFIRLGTYIALFPQLIAGPIIRYHEIEPQLSQRDFSWENLYQGIQRFCFGLARKILIANQLALIADDIFARAPGTITSATAWLGALVYALQIYYDFAGYSDMAIGLGRMFGFRFPENFNFPYLATSIRDFWRRWHITLSAWFKDYLYIPLGGNRKGKGRTYLNLYIVFFLTGLWHGASWTFVVWGLMHGTLMVVERLGFDRLLEKSYQPLRHLYTLLMVVVAWVFFRADSLDYAVTFVGRMFSFQGGGLSPFMAYYRQPLYWVVGIIALLGATPLFDWLNRQWKTAVCNGNRCMSHLRYWSVMIGMVAVLFISCCFLVTGGYNPFIYFRF